MYESRVENARAYESVHTRLSGFNENRPLREWELVILTDAHSLSRRPETFWYAVQVSRCTDEEKRAICHKLSQCAVTTAAVAVRRIRVQLHGDLFISRYRGVQVTPHSNAALRAADTTTPRDAAPSRVGETPSIEMRTCDSVQNRADMRFSDAVYTNPSVVQIRTRTSPWFLRWLNRMLRAFKKQEVP